MVAFLARRLVHGAVSLFCVVFFVYGIERGLRPENYPGEQYWPHVWHDIQRALFHLDFGRACLWPGCPHIHDMWLNGLAADLWMLAGGITIGVLVGVNVGVLCVRHPRALFSRGAQAFAMLLFCSPVYVVGLGLLLLFNRDVGVWRIPFVFDAYPRDYVSPLTNPWDWFRSYLAPWLVVAAPLGAACLRATVALTIEELDRDHVRTAVAKGLSTMRTIRHHAAPGAFVSLTALVWASIPIFVTNVVLTEWVFNVPGFLFNTKRALNQDPAFPGVDVPMLQAVALWAAVLIIFMGILTDIALARIDPRIRAAGKMPG